MLLEKINHDILRIQIDMFKDADRERKMEEKHGEYGFMQSEWGWNIRGIGKWGKIIEGRRIVNGRIVKG